LARHETDFLADVAQPLSLDELLAVLNRGVAVDGLTREDAIACYLSAGEGWREAVKRLGGAFADDEPGLRGRKGELPGG
jgi:hypothetical protein